MRLFGQPERVVVMHQILFASLLRQVVAQQRVEHAPAGDHPGLRGIDAGRARQNCITRIGRPHRGQQYLVRTINEFASVEEIANSIVARRDDRPVYLRDIAEVRQGYKEREAITRVNGREVQSTDQFISRIRNMQPGEQVTDEARLAGDAMGAVDDVRRERQRVDDSGAVVHG